MLATCNAALTLGAYTRSVSEILLLLLLLFGVDEGELSLIQS